jgi:RNA polymerase sigma factor (sigma-70 family)
VPVTRSEYLQQIHALQLQTLAAWLCTHTRDPRAAEELAPEVYFRLLKVEEETLADMESVAMVLPYARRVARNVGVDWVRERIRARGRTVEIADVLDETGMLDPSKDPARIAAASEELRLLCEEILSLPEQCSQVLTLVKVYRYSYEDAARELGISKFTVKTHLQHAHQRCVTLLSAENPGEGILLLAKLFKSLGVATDKGTPKRLKLEEPTE